MWIMIKTAAISIRVICLNLAIAQASICYLRLGPGVPFTHYATLIVGIFSRLVDLTLQNALPYNPITSKLGKI